MTPEERDSLQKLDDIIMNASADDLVKIQEIDKRTQMEGLSFYAVYVDSSSVVNPNIQKNIRKK